MAQEPKPVLNRKEAAAAAADEPAAESRANGPERVTLDDPKPQRRPGHKRAAGPARERIAANDDVPSIGGLIFALQQKPSRRPFFVAFVGSLAWLLIAAVLGGAIVASEFATTPSFAAIMLRPVALAVISTVTIPIAVFWLLALLIWRSQELRLVSSAMTEVAVRLAEPDKLAEQSVASLSQSVRRQVSSMNDAISRALGRAGELEALVHNEVTALERSYSDNERRIRNLIDELASERHALANNSERVSEALRGLGGQVVREVEEATSRVATAVGAASTAVDAKLLERGTAITDQLVRQGAMAADRMQAAGQQLNSILKQSSDRTAELLTDQGNALVQTLGEMTQRIGTEVPGLLDRLGEEQVRLITVVEKASGTLGGLQSTLSEQSGQIEAALEERTAHLQGVLDHYSQVVDETLEGRTKSLSDRLEQFEVGVSGTAEALDQSVGDKLTALETALQTAESRIGDAVASRTASFEAALDRHADEMNSLFTTRAAALDAALIERTKAIDSAFGERTRVFRDTIQNHVALLGETLDRQADDIDQSLLRGINSVRLTSENITGQSLQTIEGLANQAHSLREISEGLLQQIYELTSRFENQGQSIMRAAHTLESSNFKIDQVFENRQTELTRMIELMTSRAADFDRFLRSYSDTVENTLADVEQRTKATVQGLAREASQQSRAAVAELEQVQREFRARAEQVPSEARENANQVRRALQDQLRALDQLSLIARGEVVSRDIAPPLGQSQPVAPKPPVSAPIADAATVGNYGAPAAIPSNAEPPTRRARGRAAALIGGAAAIPAPSASPGLPTAGGGAGNLRPPRRGYSYDAPVARESAPTAPSPASEQRPLDGGRESWSFGDLLARASQDDDGELANEAAVTAGRAVAKSGGRAGDLDAMAMALSPETNRLAWERLKAGDRRVLSRESYTPQGQRTFDEIVRRLSHEKAFRTTAERYLSDFERQIAEAAQRDPTGTLERSYRDAETGRVYLMLAHALGRLD